MNNNFLNTSSHTQFNFHIGEVLKPRKPNKNNRNNQTISMQNSPSGSRLRNETAQIPSRLFQNL